GRRPLMLAARAGSVDAVRVLLDRGADPNAAETERGTTALMQAADQGHANVMSVLIEHGADVAAKSLPVARGGRTAALGKSNDPRGQVRQQVMQVLCEQESPDIEILRSLARALNRVPNPEEATVDQLCNRNQAGRGGRGGERTGVFPIPTDPTAGGGRGGRGGRGGGRFGGAGAGGVGGAGGAVERTGVFPIPVDPAEAAADSGDADGDGVADNEDDDGAGGGRGGRGREPDGGELTPLVYAARTGSIEAARVLLEAG